jgi:serpin B
MLNDRAGELGAFAENDNACALALYKLLRHQPGNLLFSPFSIRSVFAIAYAGAKGETAEQIGKALRFASSTDTFHASFAEIIGRLNAGGGDQYEMAVANSLWGQDGAPLQAAFLEHVARYYAGGMNVVDFLHDPEAARVAINRWVENHTKQKIRELIPPGGVDTATRLVLTNAVYFKGMWLRQFDQSLTRDAPFHLEGGGTVRSSMMHQRELVRYMFPGMDDFQAVELDYQGSDLSMLVLLPRRKDGLQDLEAKLSGRMLHECVMMMHTHEVMLFLPRFTIRWGTEIGSSLRALGMPLAFTRFADFSGINGHEPPAPDSLFISALYHQAFVEVNEKGTEAAAATAVALLLGGPARFRVDHPFLFVIRDRKSGAILFLGRVADPTK